VWDGLRAIGVVLSSVDSARANGAYIKTEIKFIEAGATTGEMKQLFG
jgi:hypothetical protein